MFGIEFYYLLLGVAIGFVVQLTATRIKLNGDWDAMKAGKKLALSGTGAICAGLIGLIYLFVSPDEGISSSRQLYGLWAYQVLGAWGGAEILDMLSDGGAEVVGVLKNIWLRMKGEKK